MAGSATALSSAERFGRCSQPLGYEVRKHEGRCWIGESDPCDAPINHLTLTVRCDDDSWWLAEVGMSDAVCEPLRLESGEHRQGPFMYCLETITGAAGPGWRFRHDPNGSFGGMDFFLLPARREVIEAAHDVYLRRLSRRFTRLFSVGRRDLSGAEILRGRVLIRWEDTGRSVKRYGRF